jgi:hypothetical protein
VTAVRPIVRSPFCSVTWARRIGAFVPSAAITRPEIVAVPAGGRAVASRLPCCAIMTPPLATMASTTASRLGVIVI